MAGSEAEQGSGGTAATVHGQAGSVLPDQATRLQAANETSAAFFKGKSDGALQQDSVIPDANDAAEQPGYEASEAFEEPSEEVSPAQAADEATCDAAECHQSSPEAQLPEAADVSSAGEEGTEEQPSGANPSYDASAEVADVVSVGGDAPAVTTQAAAQSATAGDGLESEDEGTDAAREADRAAAML